MGKGTKYLGDSLVRAGKEFERVKGVVAGMQTRDEAAHPGYVSNLPGDQARGKQINSTGHPTPLCLSSGLSTLVLCE